MPTSFYRHKNQIITMDHGRVAQVMADLERQHRGGELSYSPLALTKEQVAAIKAEWPPALLKLLGERNKFSKGQATTKDPMERAYDLVLETLLVDLAVMRSPSSPGSCAGRISAELALSMLLGAPPDVGAEPRARKLGDRAYDLHAHERVGRLVVNDDKDFRALADGDACVLAFFCPALARAWLVGWMTAKELRAGPRGNRTTDPRCGWGRMSYWREATDLKPMSALLRELGIRRVPDGVLFESVPDASEFPSSPGRDLDAILLDAKDAGDDYDELIFGKKPAEKPVAAPAAPPQTEADF
jgi:hypothetical protein